MPFPKDTKYPAVATNAAWQKKKSTLDKGIKTKVGPALVAAADAWADIKFDDLKTDKEAKTVKAAQAKLDAANEAMKLVRVARDKLDDAIDITDTQSKNTKLNSTSRTALKAILLALRGADKRLADLDSVELLTVDLNNAQKAAALQQQQALALQQQQALAKQQQKQREADAVKTLTDVSVKTGGTVFYTGGSGKLKNDEYIVKGGDLPHDMFGIYMGALQKQVTVKAKDGLGRNFEKQMKLLGVRGDGWLRLEKP